ncbi:MAG: M48 family metallopeptidase [Aliarcobacter sp.]|jgi:predicted Zn-dependent protease|nr:M48 family metallopeptidase [Aliarcobacter sp.]
MHKTIFLAIATLIIIAGCTYKTPYTNRSQMIFMSQKEEMALGEKSYKESLSQSKIITGTKDATRIKNIGARIAKVANRNDFQWEFNLVEDEAINAFCLPGGKVVVYTGILQMAKNDDQLATVISHEIAHALARHGAERMSSSMVQQGLQVVGNIALGVTAPQYQNLFNQTYGVGTQLGVMLPYGRMQESEADEIGIYLMSQAGYNVNEALKFWENMSEGKKEGSDFFSTHPSSTNRISDIQKVIAKLPKS